MKKTKAALGAVAILTVSVTAGALAATGALTGGEAARSAQQVLEATEDAAAGERPATSYKADETTEVLLDAEVSADDIVKIVKHGDHWHVFTKDGREIITYTDPSKAGSAADLGSTASVVSAGELKSITGNGVVRILKHGDHYHIYTADGREFITYEDPSSLYPGISIGTYTGTHGGHGSLAGGGLWHRVGYGPGVDGGRTGDVGNGASGALPEAPRVEPAPAPGGPKLSFVQVVSLAELAKQPIVKILKHDDHYHAYTADGREFITYEDPSSVFPGIKIGTYTGSHSGGSAGPKPSDPVKPIKQDPNDPRRVVKIEHHEDHWHIHRADGTEEVTYTDPSELYPDIEIVEYDEGKGHGSGPIEDSERFTYDEVEAKLIVPLEYITYGNVTHTTGFDRDSQRFIIPHHDHYHYVSIERIIQLAKDPRDVFHGHTARQVVATLKYLVLHPESRPKGENGWGSDAEIESPGGSDNGGSAGHGDSGSDEADDEGKVVVRIVKEPTCWVLYYSNGETKVVFSDPSASYPGVKIEGSNPGGSTGMTDDQIIEKYSRAYGMTRDEFEEILLELPYAPLSSIVFNDDKTVVIHGKKYDFKMPGAPAAGAGSDEGASNGENAADSERDAEALSPAPASSEAPAPAAPAAPSVEKAAAVQAGSAEAPRDVVEGPLVARAVEQRVGSVELDQLS